MLYRIFLACFIFALLNISCTSKRPTITYQKRHMPRTETKKTAQTSPTARTPIPRDTRTSEQINNRNKNEHPATNIPYNNRVENYIQAYNGIAMGEMIQYGIPASIKLAQGILESGAGMGELASKSNNHFGIKCHKEWEGGRVYHDDDHRGECFRQYNDPQYSFRDHSLFLVERERYKNLFQLRKNDYIGWALGLKKAGYATDPSYPQKLIGLIERYNLQQYDEKVLGLNSTKTEIAKTSVEKVNEIDNLEEVIIKEVVVEEPLFVEEPEKEIEKIETYAVQVGDTLYSIAKRFEITVDLLKKYNDLSDNHLSIGQILYLSAPEEN